MLRTAALALLLLALPTAAAEVRQPFSDGRLFRVSRAGIADSFVFGTIHVGDPRVAAVAARLDDALQQSKTLAIELVPQAADSALGDLEQIENGGRLEPLVGFEAFAAIRRELVSQGIADDVISRLKPWAALLRITRVETSSSETSLDAELVAMAKTRRMRTMSLELVDEQIAAFDAVPVESQVAMLKHALAHRDALAATVEPTIDAWLRGDLAALAKLPDQAGRQFPGMERHYRAFAKHVIDGRTALMHYRLFMPLREGRVFTAVGATHLYGKKGLLALIQQDGYRVTKVW
jgi:uncharacterized protein YbaP (TraB family)